jgi:2-phosphosulfolactate phosphatase
MTPVVEIGRYPTDAERIDGHAVVGVDVLRATTTAISAVANGRRCFPVASVASAAAVIERLDDALLVGERGGVMPGGFDLQNSPAAVANGHRRGLPVVLLSSSGTPMLCHVAERGRTYAACLRNARAQARRLIAGRERVFLLAAESRGELREEDLLCCGRIARYLLEAGYQVASGFTEDIVARWGQVPDDAFLPSRSVSYLRSTGQYHDVEFVLRHVDDLDSVYELRGGELVLSPSGPER